MFRLPRVVVTLCMSLTLACAGGRTPAPGGEMGMMPGITSLSPAEGRAGEAYPIQVTIEGVGFSEEGNIVTFGGIASQGLPSSENGTRIIFWVPKEAPSTGEAPPMVLTPGEYDVMVTTPAGTSDPETFLLTPGD